MLLVVRLEMPQSSAARRAPVSGRLVPQPLLPVEYVQVVLVRVQVHGGLLDGLVVAWGRHLGRGGGGQPVRADVAPPRVAAMLRLSTP